jgi:hypothetical protein
VFLPIAVNGSNRNLLDAVQPVLVRNHCAKIGTSCNSVGSLDNINQTSVVGCGRDLTVRMCHFDYFSETDAAL